MEKEGTIEVENSRVIEPTAEIIDNKILTQIDIKGINTITKEVENEKGEKTTETEDVVKFMKEVGYTYQPKLDKLMEKHMAEVTKEMFKKVDDPNRPLFSQETTRKIMNHIREESMAEVEVKEK